MDQGPSIDVVKGRLGESDQAEVLAFWQARAGFGGDAARERLAQVVCLLRAEDGSIAGVNSVFAESVPMIGGRTFWVYRSLQSADADDEDWERMLLACFDHLAAGFEPGEPGAPTAPGVPIGVFAAVARPGLPSRRPEAIWPLSGFAYAGFLADGSQARVRYFPEGRV